MLKERAVMKGGFRLTSGRRSSYYIDVKRAYTEPSILEEIVRAVSVIVRKEGVDRVAGVPVGALPIVVGVSLKLSIPFLIVRKEKRSHGTGGRIEGTLQEGERVIIIDDVATSGGSVFNAVDAIRKKKCICDKVIVVVDRCEGAREFLAGKEVELISLATVYDLGIR